MSPEVASGVIICTRTIKSAVMLTGADVECL